MKWITHQSVPVGMALLLDWPHAALAGVAFGAILPDVIDMGISRMSPNPQKTFKAIHRGFTHWFGWYALLLLFWVLLYMYPRSMGALHLPLKQLYFLGGVAFGGMFHVLLDMCTPSGIPLLPFSQQKRFSLKLFSTGSPQEYLFLALVLALFAALGVDDFSGMLRQIQRMI